MAAIESKPRVSFEFEVEKVIGVSSDGNYQVQFAPAWISKFLLVGCEHLIQEFLQQQAESRIEIDYELDENCLETQNHVASDGLSFFSERNLTLAQPASSDQSPVQNSTIKVEEAEEMNNLDTDVFTASVSQSIPTDSAVTALIDPSTSRNMIIVYNSADSNISSLSTGDRVTHPNQYEVSVSDPVKLPVSTISTAVRTAASDPFGLLNLVDTSDLLLQSDKTPNNVHNEYRFGANSLDRHTHDRHLPIDTNERPVSCDVCEKSFPNSSSLNIHLRTHSDEKDFTCDVCGKGFAWKNSLTRHKRIHTGAKPYTCEVCGMAFNQAAHRNKHVRRKHTST